jgi:hypothetical protein
MATMHCPSCGEPVVLGDIGVTFKHVFHADGRSSMFHGDTLVHECIADVAQAWQTRHDDSGSASDRWGARF